MRKLLILIFVLNFYCCSDPVNETNENSYSDKYAEINNGFSQQDFEKTKEFILSNGDRRTYRNYDNTNNHA